MEEPRSCEGLTRDESAISAEACRANCCGDPDCHIFQFDTTPREGSTCCGAVCWRGKPSSCSGQLLNDTLASGRKTSYPNYFDTTASNATTDATGAGAQGIADVVALSVSGAFLIVCGLGAGWWLLRRKMSERAVYPRSPSQDAVARSKRQLGAGRYRAGDVIGFPTPPKWEGFNAFNIRSPATPVGSSRPSTAAAPAPALGYPSAIERQSQRRQDMSQIDDEQHASDDDVVTLADLPDPAPPGAMAEAMGATGNSIMQLADVTLVDDPYGGVWACTRNGPDDSPGREGPAGDSAYGGSPMRSPGLRLRSPGSAARPNPWADGPATPIVEDDGVKVTAINQDGEEEDRDADLRT